MKKIILTILSLTLALSFTACSKGNEKETSQETKTSNENEPRETGEMPKELQNREQAEDTVKEFLDAVFDSDTEAASKYIDDFSGDLGDFKDLGKNILINNFQNAYKYYDEYEDEMEETAWTIVDNMYSYEIKDIEEKDGDFIVTVEMSTISDVDIDSTILTTAEDIPAALEEINEAYENIPDDAETEQDLLTFTVRKTDGKWLIISEESGMF